MWRLPDMACSSFLQHRTSGPVVLVGHSYGGAVITEAALTFGFLLAFSAIVEVIFVWPGIGRLVLEAITLEGRRNRVGQLEVRRDPDWVPPGSTAVEPAAQESEEETHHHV